MVRVACTGPRKGEGELFIIIEKKKAGDG